jgi:hypothetical protein
MFLLALKWGIFITAVKNTELEEWRLLGCYAMWLNTEVGQLVAAVRHFVWQPDQLVLAAVV